ncbi:MAG: hypothetical protein ACREJQ_04600 [bacterium]
MTDSLQVMLLDVRKSRPALCDVAAMAAWLDALTQLVQALPKPHQRWAAVVLVADDLTSAMPGIPLSLAYGWLAQRMLIETVDHERK